MFHQALCLLLALLLADFVVLDSSAQGWGTPLQAAGATAALYAGFLALVWWQGRRFYSDRQLLLVEVQILALLGVFFFAMGIQRFLAPSPMPQTTIVAVTLLCYGGAVAVYHYAGSRSLVFTSEQLVLLIPLVLPFTLFTLFLDGARFSLFTPIKVAILDNFGPAWFGAFTLFGCVAAVVTLFLVVPPILIWLWGCKPIDNPELNEYLEALCQRAGFRCGGIRVWKVMGHSPNAAIIGVLPRWRYILLSPGLLDLLPPRGVAAVVAHEIGHSKHRHLFLYPFIMLGMVLSGLLAVSWLTQPVQSALAAFDSLYPSTWWPLFLQPTLFLIFAAVAALYFRIVFGYFSRLCERQADLYGVTIGLSRGQIAATLDVVAYLSGNIHDVPSWHHYSMGERIDFLVRTDESAPQRHRRQVVRAISFYALAFVTGIALLTAPLWSMSLAMPLQLSCNLKE